MARTKRCKVCGSTTGVSECRRCPLCQASQDAVELGTTYGKMMAAREIKAARIGAESLVTEAPAVRKCAWCGTYFRAAEEAQYCSPKCEADAGDERWLGRDTGKAPRRCKICGELFVPWHGNQVTCSEECRLENLRRHHLSPARKKFVPRQRQYLGCGRMFTTTMEKKTYCSAACWQQTYNEMKKRERKKAKE